MLGDVFRKRVFPVIPDDPVKLLFAQVVDQVFRRSLLSVIHTHVKSCVCHVGETSFGGIQLIGGNSEIQKDSVNLLYAEIPELGNHVFVIVSYDRHAVFVGL